MASKVKLAVAGAGTALALGLALAGCSGGGGDTDGGAAADQNFEGSEFVGAGGSLRLVPNSDAVAVADFTGFRVTVLDAAGRGVPNLQITCDTEASLALLEPTSGSAYTDGSGMVSGRVGCGAPGSFRMGCRGPVGTKVRDFVTIVCGGDIPPGFDGFEGGGGGGLGNGVDDDEDGGIGGTDPNGVRITAVSLNDSGDLGSTTTTASIDVVQDSDCDGDGATADPEPFFDTAIAFKVVNNTNSVIRFTNYSYVIEGGAGSGQDFSSDTLGFVGSTEGTTADGGDELTLISLFAQARSGAKFFHDSSTAIPSDLGFTNIDITIRGRTAAGEPITLRASTVASFSNFNRCRGVAANPTPIPTATPTP